MERATPGVRDFYEGSIVIVCEEQSVHHMWISFPRTKADIRDGYDLYNKENIVAYLKGVMRWHLTDWTYATLQWVMDWGEWAVIIVLVPKDGEYIGPSDNDVTIVIKLFDIEVENVEKEKVMKFQLPETEIQLWVRKDAEIAEAMYLFAKVLPGQASRNNDSVLNELEKRIGFHIDVEEDFPTIAEMSWDDYLDELCKYRPLSAPYTVI